MEYRWIAQDKNGRIDLYEIEPILSRLGEHWISSGGQEVFRGEGKAAHNWKNSLINLETHDYKIEDGILMKVEKEQIFKGSELQYKDVNGDWYQCTHHEYRIKPKTKVARFRNYLSKDGTVKISYSDMGGDGFVKWIGDWQEVEIEA